MTVEKAGSSACPSISSPCSTSTLQIQISFSPIAGETIVRFVEGGLKDLSISRTTSLGVPVPGSNTP